MLHNGIELGPDTTDVARRTARLQLGIGQDELVVGDDARLDPVKDLRTLIEGFATILGCVRQPRLVIIGEGPERSALTALAERLGVTDALVMTGHRQDARALLPAFDIFANSSIHEGVSLTILEAMAASIPVVATDVGGNPEVVDSETGLLVPGRSAGPLGAALVALAGDAGQRRTMGTAGRRRVETHFSIQQMVSAYVASYRRATTPTGPMARFIGRT